MLRFLGSAQSVYLCTQRAAYQNASVHAGWVFAVFLYMYANFRYSWPNIMVDQNNCVSYLCPICATESIS